MCIKDEGGSGALIGSVLSKRMNDQGVERILKILLLVIVAMDFYNVLKYTVL